MVRYALLPWLLLLLALPFPQEREPEVEDALLEASQEEAAQIESEQAVLSTRLRSVLAAVEEFRELDVQVEAGVVFLSGRAPSQDTVQRASELFRQLDGVLLVVDDVQVERALGPRLGEAWEGVLEQGRGWIASLPLLGAALVILIGFGLLARLLRDARVFYRFASERELLQNLLRQTVFSLVLLAGVVVALRFLDAGAVIGTILGAAGVVGIALGFAFRNVIENYLAGVLLALRQPFRARDLVSVDGALGTVLRMTASETILMDADGNHLRLPNAAVFNGRVVNYTRNPLRRFRVAVSVGNEVDLEPALELGLVTLRRMKGILEDPDPSARIAALGDSSVQLEFFAWIDQRSASYVKVPSEAHRLIKGAFDEAGVDMPPPAYQVLLEGPPPALPQRPAEPRPGAAKPTDRGPTPEEIDVSPESDISDQVEAEIAASEGKSLLEEDPPAGQEPR